MGIYRRVEACTWGDEKFARLSAPPPCGRYLWLRLLTGPELSSVPGLIAVGRMALAEAMGWDVDGLDAAFLEIETEGLAFADWRARVILVPNAVRHNPPASPNVIRGWRRRWQMIPDCALKGAWPALAWATVGEMPTNFRRTFQAEFPGADSAEWGEPSEALLKGLSKGLSKGNGKPGLRPLPEGLSEEPPPGLSGGLSEGRSKDATPGLSKSGTGTGTGTGVVDKKRAREDGGSGGKKGSAPRSKQAPADLMLTDERETAAVDHGVPPDAVDAQWQRFKQKRFKRPYSDWDGVWRNWCIKAAGEYPQRPGERIPRTAADQTGEAVEELLRGEGEDA